MQDKKMHKRVCEILKDHQFEVKIHKPGELEWYKCKRRDSVTF